MFRNIFHISICITLLLTCETVSGQSNFIRYDSIPVIISGDTLQNPWAGGLNNPQFSEIDLNADNIKDLFVFDRDGNKILTFINNGSANSVDYTFNPTYYFQFPQLTNWALLRDYNCDGKMDIFTSTTGSIQVYRYNYDTIKGSGYVSEVNQLLTFDSTVMGNYVTISVSAADIPSISDIDNDGDLDILTFSPSGSMVEFHKNMSIEQYGTCDSLSYKLIDKCWGKFQEDGLNNTVTLGISCKTNKSNTSESSLHAGSTITALDLDGDKDKEVLIGDISYNNLVQLTNGGTPGYANMSSSEYNFPSYDTVVNLTLFPVAFHLDVNNDNLRDLIVSPNASNVSENLNNSWFYKNTGNDSTPVFKLQTKSFLTNDMIDVGSGANPVFYDYNNDSLPDLIIGNYGYFDKSGNYPSGLSLYKNVGTIDLPAFQWITNDFGNLFSLSLYGVYPAFGDLDNDGDKDMIIGESEGRLYYFTNSANGADTSLFSLTFTIYKDIDIGQYSAPQIIDVNRDGKLDLIIGERSGNINYYENKGTVTIPNFTDTATNTSWGGIDVMIPCCTGYSSPFMTESTPGQYNLWVGSEQGYLYLYKNIDGNLNGSFTLTDSLFVNGTRISVSGTDINFDGKTDLVYGEYAGGTAILNGSNLNDVNELPASKQNIILYPNPVTNKLFVKFENFSLKYKIEIFDILGRNLKNIPLSKITEHPIGFDIHELPAGILMIRIYTSQEIWVKKIIKL